MKLSGSHTSLIDVADQLLHYLDRRIPELRVSPGIIISRRGSGANQKIKVLGLRSGLDVTVTQNNTIQKLKVFTNQPELVILGIKDFCQDNAIDFVT